MQNNQQPAQRSFNVIPASHKPIRAWGYVGYRILFNIPVIGWLIWLISALGAKNKNVKNFARSYFCEVVLALIVVVILALVGVVLNFVAPELLNEIVTTLEEYAKTAQ